MRTIQRTPTASDRALLRDAATIAAAMIAVGASFGAITIAYGLPTWVPFLMSTVVFAGGAQFLAVGLLAAGNPLAAVAAGLLLNARHLPFGLAVGEALGPRKRDRIVGAHVMTDEVVAFTLAADPARRRRTYWLIGATLFTSWNLGTALGVLLGGATGDPAALGLDAAFPAALIALIMPSLRDRNTRTVALTGAAVAVLLTPVLPAGLPVICALLGLLTVVRPRRGPGSGRGPKDHAAASVSRPEGQPAVVTNRPEGQAAVVTNRPEGQAAVVTNRPEGQAAVVTNRPEGQAAGTVRRPEGKAEAVPQPRVGREESC